MSDKANVTLVMFNDYKNCYLSISAIPDMDNGNKISTTMCFAVLNKQANRMVEWEPNHGPITIITEMKDSEVKDNVDNEQFMESLGEHWFFKNRVTIDWTQTNVQSRKLPESFVNQDFDNIFDVLKSYL